MKKRVLFARSNLLVMPYWKMIALTEVGLQMIDFVESRSGVAKIGMGIAGDCHGVSLIENYSGFSVGIVLSDLG
jgi:hypothetical protein